MYDHVSTPWEFSPRGTLSFCAKVEEFWGGGGGGDGGGGSCLCGDGGDGVEML